MEKEFHPNDINVLLNLVKDQEVAIAYSTHFLTILAWLVALTRGRKGQVSVLGKKGEERVNIFQVAAWQPSLKNVCQWRANIDTMAFSLGVIITLKYAIVCN